MPRELTACEIDSIMVGATFLGAGGGGPLDTGRELLKKQTSGSYSIDLYSMDEIPEKERDATYGAMVACLGSPQKIKENGIFGPDGVACFDAFKKAMLRQGDQVSVLRRDGRYEHDGSDVGFHYRKAAGWIFNWPSRF